MMRLGYLYIVFLVSFVSASPFHFGTGSPSSSFYGRPSSLSLIGAAETGYSGSFTKSVSSSSASSSASSSSSSFNVGGASTTKLSGLGIASAPSFRIQSSGASGQSQAPNGFSSPAPGSDTYAASLVSGTQGSTAFAQNHGFKITGVTATSKVGAQSTGTELVNKGSNTANAFAVSSGTNYSYNKGDQSRPSSCIGSKCGTYDIPVKTYDQKSSSRGQIGQTSKISSNSQFAILSQNAQPVGYKSSGVLFDFSTAKPYYSQQSTQIPLSSFADLSGTVKPAVASFNIKPTIIQTSQSVFAKPDVNLKPTNEKLSSYTGFGGFITTLKPNAINVNANIAPESETGYIQIPNVQSKPSNENLPYYTGGFGGPTGLLKPDELNAVKPSYITNSGAAVHTEFSDVSKSVEIGKPATQNSPTYTVSSTGSSGSIKPNSFGSGASVTVSPGTFSQTVYPSTPVPTGEFEKQSESDKPYQFSSVKPSYNINSETVGQAETSGDSFGSSEVVKPAGTGVGQSISSVFPGTLSQSTFVQDKPTYTGGFGGPSGLLKPNEFNGAKPSYNTNSEAGVQSQFSSTSKPIDYSKPTLPSYSSTLTGPSETIKPNVFSDSHPFINISPGVYPQSGFSTIFKPSTVNKPSYENKPASTSGFGVQSGFLNPNEFSPAKPSYNGNNEEAVQSEVPRGSTGSSEVVKPTEYGVGPISASVTGSSEVVKTTEIGVGQTSASVFPGTSSLTAYPSVPKPTGGFSSLTGLLKPNEFNAAQPSYSSNSGAGVQDQFSGNSKPVEFSKPTIQNLPSYTGSLAEPSGTIKPDIVSVNQPSVTASPEVYPQSGFSTTFRPSTETKPLVQNQPAYTSGFGAQSGFLKPNEFNTAKPFYAANSGVQVQSEISGDLSSSSEVVKPTEYGIGPVSATGTGSAEVIKPTEYGVGQTSASVFPGTSSLTAYPSVPKPTGGFSSLTGLLKPNEFNAAQPSYSSNSGAGVQEQFSGNSKPVEFSKPTIQNLPSYTGSLAGPSGTIKPDIVSVNQPSVTASPEVYPQSGFSTTFRPSTETKPSVQNELAYTGGFGGPSGLLKPNEFNAAKPSNNSNGEVGLKEQFSGTSKPVEFSKPATQNLPSYSGSLPEPSGTIKPNVVSGDQPSVTVSPGVYPQSGFSTTYKPSTETKPSVQNQSAYTGGFGGPPGLLNPNEYNAAKPSYNSNSEVGVQEQLSGVSKPVEFGKPTTQSLPSYTGSLAGLSGTIKPNTFSEPSVSPGNYHQTGFSTTFKPVESGTVVQHGNVLTGSQFGFKEGTRQTAFVNPIASLNTANVGSTASLPGTINFDSNGGNFGSSSSTFGHSAHNIDNAAINSGIHSSYDKNNVVVGTQSSSAAQTSSTSSASSTSSGSSGTLQGFRVYDSTHSGSFGGKFTLESGFGSKTVSNTKSATAITSNGYVPSITLASLG